MHLPTRYSQKNGMILEDGTGQRTFIPYLHHQLVIGQQRNGILMRYFQVSRSAEFKSIAMYSYKPFHMLIESVIALAFGRSHQPFSCKQQARNPSVSSHKPVFGSWTILIYLSYSFNLIFVVSKQSWSLLLQKFQAHLLDLQSAGLTYNKVEFEDWVYEEELQKLNMEHVAFGKNNFSNIKQ